MCWKCGNYPCTCDHDDSYSLLNNLRYKPEPVEPWRNLVQPIEPMYKLERLEPLYKLEPAEPLYQRRFPVAPPYDYHDSVRDAGFLMQQTQDGFVDLPYFGF